MRFHGTKGLSNRLRGKFLLLYLRNGQFVSISGSYCDLRVLKCIVCTDFCTAKMRRHVFRQMSTASVIQKNVHEFSRVLINKIYLLERTSKKISSVLFDDDTSSTVDLHNTGSSWLEIGCNSSLRCLPGTLSGNHLDALRDGANT